MNELKHYGVKGMKWGVRRTQLKEAKKTYRSEMGSALDRHDERMRKLQKSGKSGDSNAVLKSLQRESRDIDAAKAKYKQTKQQINNETKQKMAQTAAKGAIKTVKVLNKIGKAYLTDQILFGGKGTKAVKNTAKYAGRAAVSAYMMSRGGYDIRWYDN